MNSITASAPWKALQVEAARMKNQHLRSLFAAEQDRFSKFSLSLPGLLFDYSKNLIDDSVTEKLIALAEAAELENWRDRMFAGEAINITEDRAVLHVALRNRTGKPIEVDGRDIMPEVEASLTKMKGFASDVREGRWRGFSDQKITDIVNIGIGGSDLGPKMVCEALADTVQNPLGVYFVSNVDAAQLSGVLKKLKPETTLFVVASKTFTTKETTINAGSAREWLLAAAGDAGAVSKHFVAATAAVEKAAAFGIDPANIFANWDWVGGRFSLWSAIGLPIAVALGYETFEALLDGAFEMDTHFKSAPLAENAPVLLGLLGIWNSNFLGSHTQALLPYDQGLHLFPAYMQQAEMESNGKTATRDGGTVDYGTCPIVWGQTGINGQHAFYQLLHQGQYIVPADFIGSVKPQVLMDGHHEYLMANFFAQTKALAFGKNAEEVRSELETAGLSPDEINALLPHKLYAGNRPSNTILLDTLNARTLGMLISLYEHKIFVQGILWRVCSFDQWGVELGKVLANDIQPDLNAETKVERHDASTNGLLNYFRNNQ